MLFNKPVGHQRCFVAFGLLLFLGLTACNRTDRLLKYQVYSAYINAVIAEHKALNLPGSEYKSNAVLLVPEYPLFRGSSDTHCMAQTVTGYLQRQKGNVAPDTANECYRWLANAANEWPPFRYPAPSPQQAKDSIYMDTYQLAQRKRFATFFAQHKLTDWLLTNPGSGRLLVQLDSLQKYPTELENHFTLSCQAIVAEDPVELRHQMRQAGRTFEQRYPNNFGTITLSDVAFSANKCHAVFSVGEMRGSLDGSGYIVFMKLGPQGWEIDFLLGTWIS